MTRGLVDLARALRQALRGFDPALVSGQGCVEVVEELAATEKACAAARARAAVRVADCGAHRGAGFGDAADWLARTSGSSPGEARAALETASAAEGCPRTAEALAAGELSLDQAREVVRTEARCPGSEAALVALATTSSLSALRDEARRLALGAVAPEELHRRQHQARELRHWRDDQGMVRISGALAPLVGIALVNRLDAEADRIRREARRQGQNEVRAAHLADALVALAAGGGRGRARSAEVVVVCDLAAYRRGHAHRGETCHIVGGGPIPVAVARQEAGDAFVKAVLHDGVRIDTVAHLGRHLPAELRTALELGGPPGFTGVTCGEAGCGRRHGLEWDHRDPVANGGPTSYDNLQARCWPHHRDKTERDRAAGLLGRSRERVPP